MNKKAHPKPVDDLSVRTYLQTNTSDARTTHDYPQSQYGKKLQRTTVSKHNLTTFGGEDSGYLDKMVKISDNLTEGAKMQQNLDKFKREPSYIKFQ